MASIPCASFQAMSMHKHLHQQTRVRHFSESSTCSEFSDDSTGLELQLNYNQTRRVSIADPTKVVDKSSMFGSLNSVKDRTWEWIATGGKTLLGSTIHENTASEK